jgi:hypothetical protein
MSDRAEAERELEDARAYAVEVRLREKASEDARVSAVDRASALQARVKALEAALRGLLAIAERNEAGDAVDRARAALGPKYASVAYLVGTKKPAVGEPRRAK